MEAIFRISVSNPLSDIHLVKVFSIFGEMPLEFDPKHTLNYLTKIKYYSNKSFHRVK